MLKYQNPESLIRLKGLDNTNDPCVLCAQSDHVSGPWSDATQGSATVHEAAMGKDHPYYGETRKLGTKAAV